MVIFNPGPQKSNQKRNKWSFSVKKLQCTHRNMAISDGTNCEYQQYGIFIRGIHEARTNSQTDCPQGAKLKKSYVILKLHNTISSYPAIVLAKVHHVDNLKVGKIEYVY